MTPPLQQSRMPDLHTPAIRALETFVADCLAGDVTLCRAPSANDTPNEYAEVVAVAYDLDALSLVSENELVILKRIAKSEFSIWLAAQPVMIGDLDAVQLCRDLLSGAVGDFSGFIATRTALLDFAVGQLATRLHRGLRDTELDTLCFAASLAMTERRESARDQLAEQASRVHRLQLGASR
jgi:hypothetical protein